MSRLLILGSIAALVACTEDNEPKTTTTTSSVSTGAGGEQPCTGNDGELTGVVWLNELGMGGAQPAPDTEIAFYPASGTPFIVRSDAAAVYTARLPADHYDVQGAGMGECVYPPLDVTVVACETTTLDVVLELCLGG